MTMLTQAIVSASTWMYNQMVPSSTEPTTDSVVGRVQKRRRTTTIDTNSNGSTMTHLNIMNDSTPMEGISYTDRRYVRAKRPRQITNDSTNNSSIIIPRLNLPLQQHGLVDTCLVTGRRRLNRSISHVAMDNEIQRLTNDMGRLDISTNISTDMPLELRKQSLDGLVDRFAQMDIKDDGAENDGDIIMTQASTLLEEPVYHFGISEQQGNSFRNLVELRAFQKLRRHRQRRQEFMKKRLNKYSLKMTRRN